MPKITDWGSDPFLVGLASFSSFLGLLLSIALIFITMNVNGKINKKIRKYSDVENFNKNRERHKDQFLFFQLLIEKDSILKDDIVVKILNEIEELNNYESLLSKRYKIQIWLIKRELNKAEGKINKSIVAKRLSYFISKCSKKEEYFL